MELRDPCVITSRLMAGVRVGNGEISIEYAPHRNCEGRTRYRYYIDIPGANYTQDDIQSGCQGGNLRDGLESLLGFLSACGESVAYGRRSGSKGENADLFPHAIAEWADQHSDELGMAAIEVEETPDCIVE